MVHLRIVAPASKSDRVMTLLEGTPSVCSLARIPGAASKPAGDLIFCDVAREDASVVIDDLKEMEIPRDGSITLEQIDSQLSAAAERAEKAAPGSPSDAVFGRRSRRAPPRASRWAEISSSSSSSPA